MKNKIEWISFAILGVIGIASGIAKCLPKTEEKMETVLDKQEEIIHNPVKATEVMNKIVELESEENKETDSNSTKDDVVYTTSSNTIPEENYKVSLQEILNKISPENEVK